MNETQNLNIMTHISHCCGKHGCKYGEPACPVTTSHHTQSYPCPFCLGEDHIRNEMSLLQEELQWTQALAQKNIFVNKDSDGTGY